MAKRRMNGEGSVTWIESKGLWVARFYHVDPVTGEGRRAYKYAKTATEAKAKMDAARDRVASGAPVSDSKAPLKGYAKQWTETTLKASGLKPTTVETYSILTRTHIEGGSLGAKPLGSLKPTDIERWLLALRKAGKSDSTIRQAYTVLRKILDAAVRDGLIARNPAAVVKRPTVARKEASVMSDGQVAAVLAASGGSRFHPVFVLIANTGLRRGEALALRWADVELDGPKPGLKVAGTLSRVGGQLTITAPKTERGRRTVPLMPDAVELFKVQRKRQAAERLKVGADWKGRGLVFATEMGEPLDPRNALRAFQSAAAKAGLEGVGLHTFRHSAATAMLRDGVPIHVVSDLMGHASVAITGDLYGHVSGEDAASAMALLSARRTPIGTPTALGTPL